MFMAPFYHRFPDVAANETKTLHVIQQGVLPVGAYGFLEFYCDKPGCDCRRAHLLVASPQSRDKIWATIGVGWETSQFYADWMGCSVNDPIVAELKGPVLASMAEQSEYADVLLDMFTSTILNDAYLERLKRHYALFKDDLNTRSASHNRNHQKRQQLQRQQLKSKRKAKRAMRKKSRKKR